MKNPVHETGLEDVQWGSEEQNLIPKGPRPQSGKERGARIEKLPYFQSQSILWNREQMSI